MLDTSDSHLEIKKGENLTEKHYGYFSSTQSTYGIWFHFPNRCNYSCFTHELSPNTSDE